MKKLISLLTVFVVLLTMVPLSFGAEDVDFSYQGIPAYEALFRNVSFTDINNHWAKDSIYRMASLSIIRGMGNNRFNPDGVLTREQAITLLVRLVGLEDEAQEAAENNMDNIDTGEYRILTPFDYLSNAYVDTAISNNIVTQEEVNKIETLTENENNQIEIELERSITDYETDPQLTDLQITNIENQIREKIERAYTWRRPVTREQVAVWISRVLGLQPISGQAQQTIYSFNDWENIDTQNLSIIEAVVQNGIMEGNSNGYFLPKSSLRRSEMARLLDNIHEELLKQREYHIATGIVEKINTVHDFDNNTKKIFKIKNDDGTISELEIQESDNIANSNGFVGYKDGNIVLPEAIKEFDYIKYYANPDGQVIFVEVLNNKTSSIEGYVEDVDADNREITIKDYDDQTFTLEVSQGADIRINDRWAQLKDLLYGQEITLDISNGKIIVIKGYLNTGEEGYIHPGERIYIGKVLYVDARNNSLTLLDGGTQREFEIEPYIPIIKGDENIGLNGVKEGDIVRLEFDQYQGNSPIKAYVAQPDRQIANLYKATIKQFNPNRQELILSDVYSYKNTQWNEEDQITKLPLGYDTALYINGGKVNEQYLNNYSGTEAYIVTQDNFGKEEILKIVLKSGYERNYYNTLQNIAFGDNKIIVDYNEMYFDDSTIILKDGRLIHPYNLQENNELFVISQGRNHQNAVVISVEGIDDTGIIVYRGRIDEIYQYSFELDDYDILKGTEWDFTRRQSEFNISEDTKIIDTREGDVRKVTVKEFTNSRFLKEDDRDNYYREYAYAIQWDDMIIAMNIIDKDKEAQVISTGRVSSVDKLNRDIFIEDVRDWSDFTEKWVVNDSEIELNVDDAIFIRNGKIVTINEISPQDSLYILRENDEGYIVVVR